MKKIQISMATIRKDWKKWGAFLGLLLICICMAVGAYFLVIRERAGAMRLVPYTAEHDTGGLTTTDNPVEKNKFALQMENDRVYTQTFVNQYKELHGVVVKFLTPSYQIPPEQMEGYVEVAIKKEDGELLHVEQIPLREIYWVCYRTIFMEKPMLECKGDTFCIEIVMREANEASQVYLEQAVNNEYTDGRLLIDGKKTKKDLCFRVGEIKYSFLTKSYCILALIVTVTVLIVYYMLCIRKAKLHHIYPVIGICLGILYGALIPPFAVPDEQVHYEETYETSNKILGLGTPGEGFVYKRTEDLLPPFSIYPDINTYQRISEQLFWHHGDETIVTTGRWGEDTHSICYLVPGLGMALGRLLHLGTVGAFYLARWADYIVFMILVYWAIKKAPMGKACILLFSMLPIVVQQAMSVSYDCIANGAAILLIAQCMHMAFKEESVNWKDLLLYVVLAFVLGSIKGGVYLPLCCLGIIIPMKKFAGKKYYFASMGIILIGMMAGFLLYNGSMISGVMQQGNDQELSLEATADVEAGAVETEVVAADTGVSNYGISYIWTNPKGYVKLLLSTLFEYIDFYFSSMIGSHLGWVNIIIPGYIICGYFGVLLFSTIEPGEKVLDGKQKLWGSVISGAVVLLVLTVLMALWTVRGSTLIQGVQGRYFLPIGVLILYLLKSKNIVARKNMLPRLLLIMCCLQILTCLCIIKSTIVTWP